MKIKLVQPTDLIGSIIQDETFVFCYVIGKGFIKRNLDSLNVQVPTFENIVQKIESMSLSELKTLNLDSVLFNNGSIFVSNKITKEIKTELDLIPIGTHSTFVDTLISEKKAKSRYFDILEATVVKETLTNANFISNTNISILENIAVGTLVSPNMILIDIPNYNYELLNYVDTFEFVDGKIKTKSNIDYETRINYDLQLKIVDKADATKFWLDTVHVDVVNVPDSLVIGALRTSNVAENSVNGTIAIDINNLLTKEAGLNTSLSLNNYTDKFAISGNNLIVNGVLDYETATQYIVSVKITNTDDVSMFWNTDITINIDNVADTITISQTRVANVDENSSVGTVVADLTTMFTKEANLTTSFEVLTNSDKFAISGNNLTVNGVLDFETTPQYVVSVKIINTATPTMFWTMDITVNINNLVEVVTPPAGSSIVISCSNIPQNGLMASYLLQGTAESATGNYNGTETNMTYTYDNTRGIVGNFTMSSYIVSPSALKHSSYNFSKPQSLSMWFNIAPGNANSYILCSLGSIVIGKNSASGAVWATTTTDAGAANVNGSNVFDGYLGTESTTADNKWHHVLVTHTGTTSYIYFDGILIKTHTMWSNGTSFLPTGNGAIGDSLTGYSAAVCKLSNTHFYNRAITAEEVTTIYNIEKFNHTNPIDQGLVAYYPLNGNALDYSVSGYDGTATNVTYTNGINDNKAITSLTPSTTNIVSSLPILLYANTWSVSFWHKWDGRATINYHAPFHCGDLSLEWNEPSYYSGSKYIYFALLNGSGTSPVGGYYFLNDNINTILRDNNYHNIVITHTANANIIIYIDGVSYMGTPMPTNSGFFRSTSMLIGKGSSTNGLEFSSTANMSNVRIYNRVLSDREIGLINEMERPHASCPIKALVNNPDPFGDKSGVALYKFDGDVTDVTGTYNGTATAITYADGKFGKAAVFNGSSSKITASLNIGTTSATFSGWIKPNGTNATNQRIFDSSSSNYSGMMQVMYSTTGKISIGRGNNSNNEVSAGLSNYVLPTTSYTHVVVSITGNTTQIFINGILDTTNTTTVSVANDTGMCIGTSSDNALFFNGSIDQVRIFNRAINADEVKTLYRESSMIYDTDKVDLLGDGSCKALYKFEGNANDESSNYNGTATNVTYGAGKFGTAAVFNGSSSNINCTTPSYAGGFSISMWIKWNGDADYCYLFQLGTQASGNALWCVLDDTNNTIYFNNKTSGVNGTNTTATFTDALEGSFRHIVISWDGTTTGLANIYIDGVVAVSGTRSVAMPVTTTLMLGNEPTLQVANYFNGSIDQVRIFNKALTQAEVTTLFNESNTIIAPKNNLDLFNDSSIKALYKFDGNSNDDTGTYNGTPYNITYGTGKLNKAAIFNGTNSYIQTQYKAPASSQYTYSAWMKSTTILGSTQTSSIIGDVNSAGANASARASIGFWGTKFYFNMGNGSTAWYDYTSVSALPVFDGNWHNLVLVVNGFSQKLYVDGALYAALTSTISAGTAGGINVAIGRGGDYATAGYFTGSIDHVRIYNKALNQQEINYLYNEVATNYNTDRLDFFNDGSGKALYKFDGTANDESGLYNGTQTNVTYANGKFDKCAVFNGSMIVSQANFWGMSLTIGRTLSFWLKASTPIGYMIPISSSTGYGYIQSRAPGTSDLDIYSVTNTVIGNTGVVLDNSWHHIVLVESSTGTKVYRDGVQSSTNVAVDGVNNVNMCIGTFQNNIGSTYKINGSIDQLRIFTKALTQAEITLLFNETK